MRKQLIALLVLITSSTLAQYAIAKDLKASVAMIPIHSEKTSDGVLRGGFVELIKAIDSVYPDGSIEMSLHPFKRSLYNVESGNADFHAPLIRVDDVDETSLPYAYVTEPITQVAFVIYSASEKPPINLEQMDNYKFDTIRGMSNLYPFKVTEIDSINQGIQKVLSGRIDGFIMEQEATDAFLKENTITNIRRTLYREWDSCLVIAKGDKKEAMDALLSKALKDLKASGELKKITDTIHHPYQEWQPFQQ